MSGPIGSSQWMYASGASAFYDYNINQSLRLEQGGLEIVDSSNTGNNKTFTISMWFKRTELGVAQALFGAGAGSDATFAFYINSDDCLWYRSRYANTNGGPFEWSRQTFDSTGTDPTLLIRDTSAWYHIVVVTDTTRTGATSVLDYFDVYLNGVDITSKFTYERNTEKSVSSTYNDPLRWNTKGTRPQTVGFYGGQGSDTAFLDGYIAEVHSVDGQALDETYFGEFSNGIWVPKEVSIADYGTRGFYFDFADSSNIGNDASSGGTEDYTSLNLAATDVVSDSPTNNWSTLNPLKVNDKTQTFAEGNLDFSSTQTSTNPAVTSTFAVTSGKWYWEVYIRTDAGSNSVGIAKNPNNLESDNYALYSSPDSYQYQTNGNKRNNSSSTSYGDAWTTGDIIGVALDLDAGAVYFYKNGTIQNSGTAAYTGLSGEFTSYSLVYQSGAQVYNFGQDDSFVGNKTTGSAADSDSEGLGTFYHSVPSGYKSLCASNLPEPTIGPNSTTQADDYFDIALYSGNGTAVASGGNAITSVNFAPEFVWLKRRDANANHGMYSVVQGAGVGVIPSQDSYASFSDTETLNSFDSNGFTLGSNTTNNASSSTNISWNWKLGGTPTVDNSAGAGAVPTAGSVKIDGSNSTAALAGTIPALRQSVNTTAGISITKYVGTGANATIAHSLTETPELVICKNLDDTKDFMVFCDVFAATNYLRFNGSTDGIKVLASSSAIWNDTAPTSTVVSLGTSSHVNTLDDNHIMWAFHSVEGYCRITEYKGNNDADGPFVYLGFRPRFVITRSATTSQTGSWNIFNTETYTYNSDTDVWFKANTNESEFSGSTRDIDILSNGIKIRNTAANMNDNNNKMLVIAWAENPFKYANAR